MLAEAKLFPRGEFCPLGVKLSPGGEILCSPFHSSKSIECSPMGVNEGVNIPRRGQSSTLRPILNFAPRGKL
jgi:hypothetical protein